MPKLLALDLSSNVGHAIVERGRAPMFGTLRLRGDRAQQCGTFLVWLEDMHAVHAFDGIAWERPLLLRTDNIDLLELLIGLVGIAYGIAGKHHLPYREVDVQQVKITLTGKKNASKDEMIAAAMTDLNWKVADDHQADAGSVGIHAYESMWPKKPASIATRVNTKRRLGPTLPDDQQITNPQPEAFPPCRITVAQGRR